MDEPISRPLGNCQKGKPRTLLKVSKRGGRRGGKRGGARSHKNRNNKQSKTLNFSVMGTNAAGLKAKKDSLLNNIKMFNYPSCISIQETKLRNCGNFKLKNYQVFEKRRSGFGGGLLTASIDPIS